MDGEDDEETSNGEFGTIVTEIAYSTHHYSLLFLSMLFFAEICVFVVFVVVHVARVWAYYHPRRLGSEIYGSGMECVVGP